MSDPLGLPKTNGRWWTYLKRDEVFGHVEILPTPWTTNLRWRWRSRPCPYCGERRWVWGVLQQCSVRRVSVTHLQVRILSVPRSGWWEFPNRPSLGTKPARLCKCSRKDRRYGP